MAFTPNGTIHLLAGIPLDNSYTHTVRYASKSAQYSAFYAKRKHTYEHTTYIRETNRIRVPDCSDDILECNYLMYQNLDYGADKWFYGFILGIHYVNDHCSEIEWEVDVMQTWQYDYTILPGFIERNHTRTDVIGENIVSESLDIGEYIISSDYINTDVFRDWAVIMYAPFGVNTNFQSAGGSIDNGIYSALDKSLIGDVTLSTTPGGSPTWNLDPRGVISGILNGSQPEKAEQIAFIMYEPKYFRTHDKYTFTYRKPYNSLGTYVPKNKKLFTAPYNVLYVTDSCGGGQTYHYEEFTGSTTQFQFDMYSDHVPNQTILLNPYHYRMPAESTAGEKKFIDYLTMTGMPQVAWLSDSYKSYLSTNSAQLWGSGIASIATIGTGAIMGATGNPLGFGMVASGFSAIGNTLTSLEDKKKMGMAQHGNITGTALFAVTEKAFHYYELCVKPEIAKIIDDYFSMYGYAIKEIGTPNIDSRPYWNYVKMQNTAIKPDGINGLPTADIRSIETIHNNGITYWKSLDNVGNYSLNNAPV